MEFNPQEQNHEDLKNIRILGKVRICTRNSLQHQLA